MMATPREGGGGLLSTRWEQGDFTASDHHSLSTWLLAATIGCLTVLSAAILGGSYTGLAGEWLAGDTLVGNAIFVAEVGLTEVRLRTGTGSSQTLSLRTMCTRSGGRDSEASHWCALDQLGADTEAMLTAAFVPALVVIVLSAVTAVQNCCNSRSMRDRVQLEERAQNLGITSTLYNLVMLFAWLLFWLMSAAGLCIFALRAPASLGIGAATPSKSYGLLRATVLFTSLGAIALIARALKLWSTQTVQMFLRDLAEARMLKLLLYCFLLAQLLL